MIRPLVLCLLPLTAMAAPVVENRPPPPAAYFLGDELVQELRLTLPVGVTPDPASLPRPGPQDYWLDLRQIRQETRDGVLILQLHWQNFYSAVTADRRDVPGLSLRFSDGTSLKTPGFSFVAAPLIPLTDDMSAAQMRADPPWYPAPTGGWLALFSGAVLLLLPALAGLAFHQGLWPFHRRGKRPFTTAARLLARHGSFDAKQSRRILHRAFDEAAGRVILSTDLPEFLAARPEFRQLAEQIEAFFHNSDSQFFGSVAAAAPPADLVKRLSRAERGLP